MKNSISIAITVLFLTVTCGLARADDAGWPEIGMEQKPWTRWWWLGSGVDDKNLASELEKFAAAGLGGVEICPIYGASGYEDRDIDFLSDKWMAALARTTREAKRLGLGVDMTTGTGWPFGGPFVTPAMASQGLTRVMEKVAGGGHYRAKLAGKIIALRTIPDGGGPAVDLAPEVAEGRIDWQAPAGGGWTVAGLVSKSPVQQVKRAAPGGAGNVLDPYSAPAMKLYLANFDKAFQGFDAPMPRSQFHDSFEYYDAEWSPGLLSTFQKQHGYNLLDQLPAFVGAGDADTASRVRADWRATLSEMHREYLSAWHDWANAHGSLTRNQAHGSPGNVLDHYAIADIPETEIFRHVEDAQIPMMGLAASAAHLNGRKLVSSESFTWLGEHFKVTPAALKEAADFLYLSGVNHVFFHGIPYSPEDAPWPGWLFYASTNMGPNGGLWHDMPAFTGYLARIQSVLQRGRPDSEVLLYFPFDDLAKESAGKLSLFTIHNQSDWLYGTDFHDTAMKLWNAGIPYDAVSGRMLDRVKVADGLLESGDVKAKVLVVPGAKLLPVTVLKRMLELADAGATVMFDGGLPVDVPGLGHLEERRKEMRELLGSLHGDGAIPYGRGMVVAGGGKVMSVLAARGVEAEPMCIAGLRMVRRIRDDGWDYFVVNHGSRRVDRFLPLARPFVSAQLLDPADAARHGLAETRGNGVRLALDPGESVVIRSYGKPVAGRAYPYRVPAGGPVAVSGEWNVEFLEGGPALPAPYRTRELSSWTERGDPLFKSFSGTARYAIDFETEVPDGPLLLDLGEVGETCRATLNGSPLGLSFFPPHRFDASGKLREKDNHLVIDVTNLAANRIADLDRRKVDWKRFHEINFVNIDYKPFDASGWTPLPSGLMGPVRLVPVR